MRTISVRSLDLCKQIVWLRKKRGEIGSFWAFVFIFLYFAPWIHCHVVMKYGLLSLYWILLRIQEASQSLWSRLNYLSSYNVCLTENNTKSFEALNLMNFNVKMFLSRKHHCTFCLQSLIDFIEILSCKLAIQISITTSNWFMNLAFQQKNVNEFLLLGHLDMFTNEK